MSSVQEKQSGGGKISRMLKKNKTKKKPHTHVPFQNQLNFYKASDSFKVCVIRSDVGDAIVLYIFTYNDNYQFFFT